MFDLFIFFIILSTLVLIHEFGHFIAAKKNNVLVEEFGFGLPPRIFGIKRGETLYSLNWLPIGGFVKVFGEEEHEIDGKQIDPALKNRTFVSKPTSVKIMILTAGVLANFILGWFVMSYLFTQGVAVPTNAVTIEAVTQSSPAEQAGIQKNDTISALTVAGTTTKIVHTKEFVDAVKKAAGQDISLDIIRQGKVKTVSLTPRVNPPKGEGALGVTLTEFIVKKYTWYQAPFFSLIESANITYQIAKELGNTLFQVLTFHKPSVDVAGPVGILKITSDAIKVGYMAVLQLLGILSLNLAVVNILPFPALDGGRLAFVLYEHVTRRKINTQIERKLNMAGFAILLTLIALVTLNDIIKLFVK